MAADGDEDMFEYLYTDLLPSAQEEEELRRSRLEQEQKEENERRGRERQRDAQVARLEAQLARTRSNFSALLKTARRELARRDARVAELKQQLDDVAFRRALVLGARHEFEKVFAIAHKRDESKGEEYQKRLEVFLNGGDFPQKRKRRGSDREDGAERKKAKRSDSAHVREKAEDHLSDTLETEKKATSSPRTSSTPLKKPDVSCKVPPGGNEKSKTADLVIRTRTNQRASKGERSKSDAKVEARKDSTASRAKQIHDERSDFSKLDSSGRRTRDNTRRSRSPSLSLSRSRTKDSERQRDTKSDQGQKRDRRIRSPERSLRDHGRTRRGSLRAPSPPSAGDEQPRRREESGSRKPQRERHVLIEDRKRAGKVAAKASEKSQKYKKDCVVKDTERTASKRHPSGQKAKERDVCLDQHSKSDTNSDAVSEGSKQTPTKKKTTTPTFPGEKLGNELEDGEIDDSEEDGKVSSENSQANVGPNRVLETNSVLVDSSILPDARKALKTPPPKELRRSPRKVPSRSKRDERKDSGKSPRNSASGKREDRSKCLPKASLSSHANKAVRSHDPQIVKVKDVIVKEPLPKVVTASKAEENETAKKVHSSPKRKSSRNHSTTEKDDTESVPKGDDLGHGKKSGGADEGHDDGHEECATKGEGGSVVTNTPVSVPGQNLHESLVSAGNNVESQKVASPVGSDGPRSEALKDVTSELDEGMTEVGHEIMERDKTTRVSGAVTPEDVHGMDSNDLESLIKEKEEEMEKLRRMERQYLEKVCENENNKTNKSSLKVKINLVTPEKRMSGEREDFALSPFRFSPPKVSPFCRQQDSSPVAIASFLRENLLPGAYVSPLSGMIRTPTPTNSGKKKLQQDGERSFRVGMTTPPDRTSSQPHRQLQRQQKSPDSESENRRTENVRASVIRSSSKQLLFNNIFDSKEEVSGGGSGGDSRENEKRPTVGGGDECEENAILSNLREDLHLSDSSQERSPVKVNSGEMRCLKKKKKTKKARRKRSIKLSDSAVETHHFINIVHEGD